MASWWPVLLWLEGMDEIYKLQVERCLCLRYAYTLLTITPRVAFCAFFINQVVRSQLANQVYWAVKLPKWPIIFLGEYGQHTSHHE